jgi:hypothetical protein
MGRLGHGIKRRRDQALIQGLKKHAKVLPPIQSMDLRAVLSLLEDHVKALDEQEAARAAHRSAVQRERALEARVQRISGWVREAVHAAFGGDPRKLGDFGLVPRKPTGPKKPEVIVQAAAKAGATRAARHTLGERQKEKIKGGS